MSESPYDILKMTFCVFCQDEMKSPEGFQNHILARHQGTHQYWEIIEIRKLQSEIARDLARVQAKPMKWRRVQRPPKRG